MKLLTASVTLSFAVGLLPSAYAYPCGSAESDNQGGYPAWGNRTCYSDPEDVPETGVIRKYDWTVQRTTLAPDGFEQSLLTVNGQFPGPLLEANWGDIVEVTVHNNITGPAEGTAMHWHGIHQQGTPWMDGVSGITQCPIAPGESFTYRWKATTFGSSWWHAHHALQYGGGLWGPIVIRGPSHVEYDFDLGPIMLSDYYHQSYEKVAMNAISNSTDFKVWVPHSDNHLINGKNNYNCSMSTTNNKCISDAQRAQFKFQSGKVHKLRVINTGVQALQLFSIDGHKLQVTSMDWTPVEPYEVDYLALGVGQRAEVLVTATGDPKAAYYMRTKGGTQCATTFVNETLATVYYDQTSADAVPVSNPYTIPDFTCGNPIYKKPLVDPDITLYYDVTFGANETGNREWLMNNVTFKADWSRPLLLEAADGNIAYLAEPQHIMTTIPENVRNVRVVLNNRFSVHPFHLHGGNFQIVSEADGPWDGTIAYKDNPARADTELLRRSGHLVVQFEATNPGVWSFHCHTAWHASVGLYINFLVQPKAIQGSKVPQEIHDMCSIWESYKKSHGEGALPFDSGL
ncbi:multicopper oxidase [Fusarium mundagurra]|uniref:Multicopper oxidase n=1 Tax=Fusarium mundagurra TaxID=1567541 RepID=A0A8H5XTN6_9HYPO|nr:multicopper oxidase [Fusarium mundagurra]